MGQSVPTPPEIRSSAANEARNQLAGLMDAVSRDREPITITRNGAGKVVLLTIEEYEAIELGLTSNLTFP